MPEGLSATEVGKEIGEHAKHANGHTETSRHDRLISLAGAVLLSIVTITAAWSGYSAAKWGTESSLNLAKASATRTKANRYFQEGLSYRTADALLFNAWFGAYITGNKNGMRVAERRFRPQFEVAFVAWLATHPFTNPNAPPGPQSMPQYKPIGEALSRSDDAQANAYYAQGQNAAGTGDDYVRVTLVLASVLFLLGISTQFASRGVRYGLLSTGALLLLLAAEQILSLPGPP